MTGVRPDPELRRWVGIDEAGYGPNLGPLVMVAVAAEGSASIGQPDLWADLARTVSRAGEPGARLWVDDSKKVFKARKGLDRLDAATCAVVKATGRPTPRTLGQLCESVGAGSLLDVELDHWLDSRMDPEYPPIASRGLVDRAASQRPFAGAPWTLVDVRAAVVGPRRFNEGLARSPIGSKADVHFAAFARLLRHVRETTPSERPVAIRGDKHGGRHFYGPALSSVFPESSVRPIAEGAERSLYRIDDDAYATLTVELVPRADAGDGLVALASIVAKTIRGHWMEAFNRFWQERLPDLKASAGYPVDAGRFRREIEAEAEALGIDPSAWWRSK